MSRQSKQRASANIKKWLQLPTEDAGSGAEYESSDSEPGIVVEIKPRKKTTVVKKAAESRVIRDSQVKRWLQTKPKYMSLEDFKVVLKSLEESVVIGDKSARAYWLYLDQYVSQHKLFGGMPIKDYYSGTPARHGAAHTAGAFTDYGVGDCPSWINRVTSRVVGNMTESNFYKAAFRKRKLEEEPGSSSSKKARKPWRKKAIARSSKKEAQDSACKEKTLFICSLCSKVISNKQKLQEHMEDIHGQTNVAFVDMNPKNKEDSLATPSTEISAAGDTNVAGSSESQPQTTAADNIEEKLLSLEELQQEKSSEAFDSQGLAGEDVTTPADSQSTPQDISTVEGLSLDDSQQASFVQYEMEQSQDSNQDLSTALDASQEDEGEYEEEEGEQGLRADQLQCQLCDSAFVTKRGYDNHLAKHETGKFKRRVLDKKSGLMKVRTSRYKRWDYSSSKLLTLQLDDFISHFGIRCSTFEEILKIAHNDPACMKYSLRKDRGGKAPTSTEKSLLMMLSKLQGMTHRQVASRFGMQQSTSHTAIFRMLDMFVEEFFSRYVKWPSTPREVKKAVSRFQIINSIKRCVGAMDCFHVGVDCHATPPDRYQNINGQFSTIILLVTNADMRVTYLSTGWPGGLSDVDVLKGCNLYGSAEAICGENVVLGGDTLPLEPWLITRYYEPVSQAQEDFNLAFQNTHSVVSRAFSLIARRFPAMRSAKTMLPVTKKILTTSCVLHNFCLEHGEDFEGMEISKVDRSANSVPEDWQGEVAAGPRAIQARDALASSFI